MIGLVLLSIAAHSPLSRALTIDRDYGCLSSLATLSDGVNPPFVSARDPAPDEATCNRFSNPQLVNGVAILHAKRGNVAGLYLLDGSDHPRFTSYADSATRMIPRADGQYSVGITSRCTSEPNAMSYLRPEFQKGFSVAGETRDDLYTRTLSEQVDPAMQSQLKVARSWDYGSLLKDERRYEQLRKKIADALTGLKQEEAAMLNAAQEAYDLTRAAIMGRLKDAAKLNAVRKKHRDLAEALARKLPEGTVAVPRGSRFVFQHRAEAVLEPKVRKFRAWMTSLSTCTPLTSRNTQSQLGAEQTRLQQAEAKTGVSRPADEAKTGRN